MFFYWLCSSQFSCLSFYRFLMFCISIVFICFTMCYFFVDFSSLQCYYLLFFYSFDFACPSFA